MTPVYVNARFLTQSHTGVQRFATQVSLELARLRPDLRFLVPDRPRLVGDLDHLDVRVTGRLAGHAWEQWDLPRQLAREGGPLLLNLGSTAPVRYDNQISTHHDITYVRYPSGFSRPFRLLYALLVPQVIRHSRALVTVSEFSRSELSGHFGVDESRFTVVYNAADARFTPDDTSSGAVRRARPYFLAVSSPNAHKNFGRLLEAFALVSRQHPDVELLVVGSQAKAFTQQTFDSDAGVHFLGRVSDADLVPLYRGALGFVFPSLYEGFGIPPVEAQSCGCAVIASRAASLPEVLRDSALLVDALDVNDLAGAMTRLLTDPDLRASLVAAGDLNSRRFSWQGSAEVLSRLIDHTLTEAGPAR